LRFSAFFACAAAAAFAGCGALNTPGINANTAEIRFVNGSPDQGALDLDISGAAVAADIPYRELSAYTPIAPGTYTIAAAPTGTTTALAGATSTSVVLSQNRNYTVVVGGSTSGTRLLCVFTEPIFATATGSAVVSFHDCSPGSGAAIAVGTFAIASGVTTQIGATLGINQSTGAQPVPASAANTGTGIYAISPTTAQLLPATVDVNDTQNFLPFTGSAGETDLNLSAYVVDGTGGGATTTIVGSFDPN
jgi:hypothetical protein